MAEAKRMTADEYRESMKPKTGTETTIPTAPKDFQLFENEAAPERKVRTEQQKRDSFQKGRDTSTMSKFESVNTFPKDVDQLRSWADSLSTTNARRAILLDEELQKRGKSGLLDPKLTPYEKSVVEKLFHETSPSWFNRQNSKAKRRPGGNSDERFQLDPEREKEFKVPVDPGAKPRSSLPEVPNAVAALGGQMMAGEEEDA